MTYRWVVMASLAMAITGCSLPRPGPSISEIENPEFGLRVMPISQWRPAADAEDVSLSSSVPEWIAQSSPFLADRLTAGDRVRVLISESTSNGTVLQTLSTPVTLDDVAVEEDGTVRIPYAGTVAVQGLTASQAAARITAQISRKIFRPQVQITRTGSDRRSVNLLGENGSQEVELTPNQDSLTDIVLAGNAPLKDDANYVVELRRGANTVTWPYSLVTSDRAHDVPLLPGDIVRLTRTSAHFTILGSVGQSQRVTIPNGSMSLVEALGVAGGLDSERASPQGVYVFRSKHDGGHSDGAAIYKMDMRSPRSILAGNAFPMRDGDVVYVSYSSFTQTQKVLRAISGSLGVGGTLSRIAP